MRQKQYIIFRTLLLALFCLSLFSSPSQILAQEAENVITMTTSKQQGESIVFSIKAEGNVEIDGVTDIKESNSSGWLTKSCKLTSSTITIKGNVLALRCEKQGLTSLDISKTKVLTELDVWKNQLTILNLSDNTALTRLECSGNSLTELNVTGVQKLNFLGCSENQLSTLDLTNNPALKILYCYKNKLTMLDITKNLKLQTLNFINNELTTIDVSKHKLLEILQCGENPLKTLDVSKNTKLKNLYCLGNQLTELDVTHNLALKELNCSENQLKTLDVSKNTKLTKLYCLGNQLTELDVTHHLALRELNCSKNQLTTLDLSKNVKLWQLNCYENKLTELDVTNKPDLINISCSQNLLTELDVTQNPALWKLNCDGNKLTQLNVSNNPKLRFFYCSQNELTELDVTNNTDLEYFYCEKNKLTELNVANNTKLTELYCGLNKLSKIDITKNTDLRKFFCWGNELTELDVTNNKKLEYLNCYLNYLPTLDVDNNSRLKTLLCSNNKLTTLEVTKHPMLKYLNASHNLLREVRLEKCQSLNKIELHVNQLNKGAMEDIVNNLSDTPEEKFFFVVDKTISEEGNHIDKTTVQKATAKHWNVRNCNGGKDKDGKTDEKGIPYEGDIDTYVVTLETGLGGTISIKNMDAESLKMVEAGTELLVVATPEEGYELASLTANDKDIKDSHKFVVESNTQVKASFKKQTFAVILPVVEHAKLSIKGASNLSKVEYGTELELEILPEKGFLIGEVRINDKIVTDPYKFVVKGDVKIEVQIKKDIAIETIEVTPLHVYPNPATTYIKVEGISEGTEVCLLTIDGRVVLANHLDNSGKLDVSFLKRGTYLLQVGTESYIVVLK